MSLSSLSRPEIQRCKIHRHLSDNTQLSQATANARRPPPARVHLLGQVASALVMQFIFHVIHSGQRSGLSAVYQPRGQGLEAKRSRNHGHGVGRKNETHVNLILNFSVLKRAQRRKRGRGLSAEIVGNVPVKGGGSCGSTVHKRPHSLAIGGVHAESRAGNT